ncbi:MAG: hypothetical protein QME42_06410, partial [bacterium]|nr:hypothetical protein [bacterium]
FENSKSEKDLKGIKEEARDYDGILIFGVELNKRGNNLLPTRTQFAEITRAFNREYHYTPVVVVFKYDKYISFASAQRFKYSQEWREGEKAGKVSLLKDIDFSNPHTGHLKILQSLAIERAGKKAVNSFSDLYEYWQEVFSVSILNKQFYEELFHWYLWAVKNVKFPDDVEKDEKVRNAISIIRLITRLIFIWFVKEKGLIPDELFDQNHLKGILNYSDKTGSTYYKAILQNLFFATLNTEMNKDKPNNRKFVNRQYGIPYFYRYARFFTDTEKESLVLFENIPFLNGGLFECLDKNVGQDNEVRIDCFSERPINETRLKVPDELFFSPEKSVDLNEAYGTKNKSYKVKGLINILGSYKFTITENTPIEEEVALDPELLGKVFESLLASYNPETQTTARKQTGSYYTPREIVNYMVDESLLAYLSNAIISDNDKDEHLRHLFSYTEEEHKFTDQEVSLLVDAIDNIKILDPACGSGAFPMGILHKLVYILRKLDPDNQRWKQKQKDKVLEIPDSTVREKLLEDIETAFANNELDYGRKLYLIENCIYGVDIQPIACQIAKLRFFISLIVDQKTDATKQNMGVRPLPNLETKFVAANTLIGIEKPAQMTLRNPEIDSKEEELKKVRERHFTARTPQTKENYRKEDERLRAEISGLLKRDGWPSDITDKLVHWEPYDQNASAGFFDAEWMFGIKDGFDVAIANPPYGNLLKSHEKKSMDNKYPFSTLSDISSPFIERGFTLLKEHGNLIFIITYAITFSKDFSKSRELMAKGFAENYVYTFDRDKCRIFESMTQTVSIIKCFNKNSPYKKGIFTSRMFRETPDIHSIHVSNVDNLLLPIGAKYSQKHRLPKIGETINIDILNKLLSFKYKAKEAIQDKGGERIWVRTSGNYWYNVWDKEPYKSSEIKPISVKQSYSNFVLLLINSSLFYFWFRLYGDGRHMNFDILNEMPIPEEKFIRRQDRLLTKLSKSLMNSLFSVFDKERDRFLTSNIKDQIDMIDLVLCKYFYGLNYEEILHIMNYDSEVRTGIKLQQPFIALVNQILFLKKSDPNADTSVLEAEIDRLVYELYGLTEEEIKIIER